MNQVFSEGLALSSSPVASRGQVARWQALRRPGCQMHLGPAEREGEREASHQSAQILVQQCRRGEHEWRLRGYLSAEAAATGSARPDRLRLGADLSLSRIAARHAQ